MMRTRVPLIAVCIAASLTTGSASQQSATWPPGLQTVSNESPALSPEESAKLMSGVAPAAQGLLGDGDDGEALWHDPSISLAERMTMAEGRPLRRRMKEAAKGTPEDRDKQLEMFD